MSLKLTTNEFIRRSIETHGNKYDYSLVVYINQKTKVSIICPKHGIFKQLPDNHYNKGNNCPKCYNDNEKLTKDIFIQQSKIIHNNKYNYSLVTEFTRKSLKVKIICPVHGVFEQTPRIHLEQQSECPKCAVSKKYLTTAEFIERSNLCHNNKYDYSLVKYISEYIKVKIICPVHGVFEQTPTNHLHQGANCPKCTFQISKAQNEIFNFVSSLTNNVILEDRSNYPGLWFDITIPEKNLAIEYNGIHWHSINYENVNRYSQQNHLRDKMIKAQELGLRVINIYEDEWKNSRPQIEQIIKNALGVIETKIYARKCKIWSIFSTDDKWDSHIKPFFNKFHHQKLKHKVPGVAYCLVFENQIYAIAYFGCNSYHNQNNCELIRYATRADVKVVGGLSKLTKNFFRNNPNIEKIISYCDARLFTGEGYKKAGFEEIDRTAPGFDVIIKQNNKFIRKHRSCIIKSKLSSYFDEKTLKSKTQMELAADLGWKIVPDCGLIVFYLNNLTQEIF